MTESEKQAFDAMREALRKVRERIGHGGAACDIYADTLPVIDAALTAAKEVTAPTPMLTYDDGFLAGEMSAKAERNAQAAPAAPKVEPVLADGGPPCSDHPDAPHGFNRTSSHSLGRYVCDCEGWIPEAAPAAREPVATLTIGVEDSERGTAKFDLLNYNLPAGEYKLVLQSGAAPQQAEPKEQTCD